MVVDPVLRDIDPSRNRNPFFLLNVIQQALQTIARFLSADPHIQDPSNLQAWNRYTYVLNNPLSLTDPTGFFFKSLFKANGNFFRNAFRAIGGVFKQLLRSPIFRAIVQVAACSPGLWTTMSDGPVSTSRKAQ